MTCRRHIYDETGRCFECDAPRLEVVSDSFLPDWLQEIANQPPEGEIMLDKKPYNQVDADRRYRAKQKAAKQKAKGLVRKTVLVPEKRVKELRALCRQWREEG